jgi:hypothetical protein
LRPGKWEDGTMSTTTKCVECGAPVYSTGGRPPKACPKHQEMVRRRDHRDQVRKVRAKDNRAQTWEEKNLRGAEKKVASLEAKRDGRLPFWTSVTRPESFTYWTIGQPNELSKDEERDLEQARKVVANGGGFPHDDNCGEPGSCCGLWEPVEMPDDLRVRCKYCDAVVEHPNILPRTCLKCARERNLMFVLPSPI